MRNVIILCAILLIAIAALAAKYFNALAGRDNNTTKVLNHIPSDAALIFHFNSDESFFEIFKGYQLFSHIIGPERSNELNELKNLLSHTLLSEVTSDKKIFLSLHNSADSVEFLFCVPLDSKFSTDQLKEALIETPQLSRTPLDNELVILHFTGLKKPIYLFMQQGIAIASFSQDLIKRSTNEKSPHLSAHRIEEINKASSKNVNAPLSLFINHEAVAPFLKGFMDGEARGDFDLLTAIKGSSSLSMNFKSDAVMFNGISSIDTLAPNYFNIFLHQKPVANAIKKVLPDNTSNFLAFGLSDMNRFHADMRNYFILRGEIKGLEDELREAQVNTGVNLDRDVKPLLDKEFISIENSYAEKFAIIKVTDGRNINFKLQLLSRSVSDAVSQLNYNNIFYYYFGEPFKKFKRPYFAVADNYLIIANLPGIITNYLDSYEKERFLYTTSAFKQYDQLVANESNILYFVNIAKSGKVIKSVLKSKYSANLVSDKSPVSKFYGLSYQWASEKDHFFSNFYLNYNSTDSIPLKQ